MKRISDICGGEADEYWMFPFDPGTRRMWLCWDCYKNSQYEAAKSDLARQKKLYQMSQANKRNR